jgi:Nucleotide-diphospho-sugar transferase
MQNNATAHSASVRGQHLQQQHVYLPHSKEPSSAGAGADTAGAAALVQARSATSDSDGREQDAIQLRSPRRSPAGAPCCSCEGGGVTVRAAGNDTVAAPTPHPSHEEASGSDADPASSADQEEEDGESSPRWLLSPPGMVSNLFAGAALVKRDDFAAVVDTGVPIDPGDPQRDDVLILYTSTASMPRDGSSRNESNESSTSASLSPAQRAVENCLSVRVVMTEQDVDTNCIALMAHPEESFHVHRFHRIPVVPSEGGSPDEDRGATDRAVDVVPLRRVPQTTDTRGNVGDVSIPDRHSMDRYFKELVGYLGRLQDTLERLRPFATLAAGLDGSAVVAMAVNKGQSELLVNFVCGARSRQLDLSHVLVFATDGATAALASALGLRVFDVRGAFGDIPTEAAAFYGDDVFGQIVLAKIYCVHLLVWLGHDVLLQDVDVVWHRNPLEYFARQDSFEPYDMVFQDDGNTSPRFAPYFANTGMYFVRSNFRTVYFYSHLVRMGDMLRELRCDQELMTAHLNEHVSLRGLRVKVLGRHTEAGRLFPTGYHYHVLADYMKKLLKGEIAPYAFHMNWTQNKAQKRTLLAQMGEWRVQPECAAALASEAGISGVVEAAGCCSAEPLAECHHRDLPSVRDCRDSPPYKGDRDPFWPEPFVGAPLRRDSSSENLGTFLSEP